MIKKALEYIISLGKAETQEIGSHIYSDKPLNKIADVIPKPEIITVHTLTSLVDYIKSKVDNFGDRMILEIEGPERVKFYTGLDYYNEREYVMQASARVPRFEFDNFIGQERFIIGVQSQFVPDENRELLLRFAGTVESGTVANYGDDGVTQKATVKTGIASKSDAIIPSPIRLSPYRTFLEVEQPSSEFIFRMKEQNGIACALFEADGGAWKNEAAQNIKKYLEGELREFNYVILA